MNLISILLLALPQAGVPAQPAVTPAELEATTRFLSDDALGGRLAGSHEADRAAYWLAAQFAAAGLEPAGVDGSWFQPFLIDLPPRAGNNTSLTYRREGAGVESTAVDFPVRPLALSATASASGPLRAVGYGIDDEDAGYNDYAGSPDGGFVAVIRRYTPAGPQAHDPALRRLGSIRMKVRTAIAHGAVAVLLGTHPHDLAAGGEPSLAFDAAGGKMPVPVLTVDPRVFQRLERLAKKGAQFVDVEAEVLRERRPTLNVLGKVAGTSPETIVLGAHYDHLGHGEVSSMEPGSTEVHNGADDNASGTAVTLELAQLWADLARNEPQPRTVLFALWSGEEEGLLGSAQWVENPTVPFDDIVCNINMDMVGRVQAGSITVGGAGTCAAFAPALETARTFSAPLELDVTPGDTGVGGSDHMSFQKLGIPALFFFSGLHSDYHRPSDDWEKLDYEGMVHVAKAVVSVTGSLMDTPRANLAYTAPVEEDDPHANMTMGGDRAWFGSIPDYSASPEGGGMALAGTAPDGPAAKAGLKSGDVIKKIGDIVIGDIYDFMDSLAKYKPGDTIQVIIERDGASLELQLTLGYKGAPQ